MAGVETVVRSHAKLLEEMQVRRGGQGGVGRRPAHAWCQPSRHANSHMRRPGGLQARQEAVAKQWQG